jgi:hypothetical protein
MRGLLIATLVIVLASFSASFVGQVGSALGQDSGRFRVQDEWVINKTDQEERQKNPSSDAVAPLGGGLSFGLYVHRATKTVGKEYVFQ